MRRLETSREAQAKIEPGGGGFVGMNEPEPSSGSMGSRLKAAGLLEDPMECSKPHGPPFTDWDDSGWGRSLAATVGLWAWEGMGLSCPQSTITWELLPVPQQAIDESVIVRPLIDLSYSL